MNTALLLFLLASILILDVMATLAVKRDEYAETLQKVLQILLVWLVPILGALLVLGVHRKPEKSSGSYRSDGDRIGDDFGTQRPIQRITEALDDD